MKNAIQLTGVQSLLLYLCTFFFSAYISKARLTKIKLVGKNKEYNYNSIVMICLLPVLLGAFRYYVGTDYRTYLNMYNTTEGVSLVDALSRYLLRQETAVPGIILASKIAHQFSSHQLFFGILAVFSCVPVVTSITKQWDEVDSSLALLAFFLNPYVTGFNIIKQSIACGIILWGLQFIYDRKLIKFLLVVCIASMFHLSAIVFLPMYYLWSKKNEISNIKKALIIFGTIVLMVGLERVLTLLGGRWAGYTNSSGTSNLMFYLDFAWLLIFLSRRKQLLKLSSKNELLIMLYTIGTILMLIGFWETTCKRISMFFTYPIFLLLPQLPLTVSLESNKKTIKTFVYVYVIVIFVYTFYVKGQAGIFPVQLLF